MIRTIVLGLSLLAGSSVARADQCQSVETDQGVAAEKLLKDATVLSYCEPCGDARPTKAPTGPVRSVKVHLGASKNLLTLAVDGKDVDLAYTFIQTGKATFTNVAMMVGCQATGVSGFVTIGGAAPAPGGDRVTLLEDELRLLDAQVTKAIDGVKNATNQADRAAANARLSALQREKRDLQARLAAARAAAAKAAREKGVHVSKECMDNPLAKGCP